MGFGAADEAERSRMASERQRLGFDPTQRPHELGRGKRDAKLILRALVATSHEREHRCLTEPDLEMLRHRGEGCGLTAFLHEVEQRVVSLVRDGRRP